MNKSFKNTQQGFNLIELMVSIAIGLFIIIAAAYAFQEAQRAYTVNENIARLQEQAQFVLDTLEEDIRMSSFWGLHNRFNAVSFDTASLPAPITGDCTIPWALNVSRGMTGTNNANPSLAASINNWADTGCIAATNTWQNGTDSLVVRHAGSEIIPVGSLATNKIYVASVETPLSIVFSGNALPAGTNPESKVYELQSHGYYLRTFSYTAGDGIPMMRKLALVGGPAVQDRELAVGVEDFQIEFGIDTSGYANANRGSINRYVRPDSVIIDPTQVGAGYNPEAEILSARVWLLMRTENEELNYTNDKTYSFAGKTVTPNDAFRRLLVSSTFYIRNRERN